MIRTDKLGATSVIRALGLKHSYEPLNKFFRSDAWKLKNLEQSWMDYLADNAPLYRYNGSAVIVGDGTKVSKEGKKIPAVKKLHQDSEDSSKAATIMGQMYGSVGVLAETGGKTYCLPLACELQDGVKTVFSWGDEYWERQGSHTVELMGLAHRMARSFPNAILLLDRYFLTIPALDRLDALNAGGGGLRAIIMAKSNVVAYELPGARAVGAKGRPPIKGNTVKLSGLFKTEEQNFKCCKINIYGKDEVVKYLVKDLLWGKGRYRLLRFVLVVLNGRRVIIASTDTGLSATGIITLYSKRFSIESSFKTMKQDVGAFTNRFWSHFMPKLNRYTKSGEADRLANVNVERERKLIRKALEASECYVFCGVVATGLLQMVSLMHFKNGAKKKLRYLRTPSKTVESEATVADFLRKNILWCFKNEDDLAISKIIFEKMDESSSIFEFKEAG